MSRSRTRRLDYGSRYISRFLENYAETRYLIRPRQSRREIHLQLVRCTKWRFVEDISSLKLATPSIHPSVCPPRLFHETLDRADDQLEKLNYFLK